MFHPFVKDKAVRMIGVEAAGLGLDSGLHAATLMRGSVGVLHGSRSYVLQDAEGQTLPVHSVSAGLDYPGVGPEHSYWKESGRAKYVSATDQQALDAFGLLSRLEGIIPALESAHAVAHAAELAAEMKPEEILVICLSGRGDKDCVEVAEKLGQKL
jgi:tryptophan synthase beta chain